MKTKVKKMLEKGKAVVLVVFYQIMIGVLLIIVGVLLLGLATCIIAVIGLCLGIILLITSIVIALSLVTGIGYLGWLILSKLREFISNELQAIEPRKILIGISVLTILGISCGTIVSIIALASYEFQLLANLSVDFIQSVGSSVGILIIMVVVGIIEIISIILNLTIIETLTKDIHRTLGEILGEQEVKKMPDDNYLPQVLGPTDLVPIQQNAVPVVADLVANILTNPQTQQVVKEIIARFAITQAVQGAEKMCAKVGEVPKSISAITGTSFPLQRPFLRVDIKKK